MLSAERLDRDSGLRAPEDGLRHSRGSAILNVAAECRNCLADVWIGALTTAVLFSVGQIAIGLYLTRSAIASAYGAAGALVVLLLWLYYSAQIFLLGTEFTQVYANRHVPRYIPTPGHLIGA